MKKPKLEDTKLVLLFEMADRLKARAGKDALLSLPDVQIPMDVAALIWEKSDFFAAMYEAPEAVQALAEMVKQLQFDFFDEWFRRYGSSFIAHFPEYYMPFGITISEDEVGVVSSEMYQKFFEQELHAFSQRYGAIGVHCCADSKHQWENFANIPNLKILNLCRERDDTLTSLDRFRNVCGQYPGCKIRDLGNLNDPNQIHLAQYCTINTIDEARRIAEYFTQYGVLPVE